MNDEKFNSTLREALRLMAGESAPAPGWERRVLDESTGKPRRRIWVRLSVAAISAAAAALILLIMTRPGEPLAVAPASAGSELLIAQAPGPYKHIEPVRPVKPSPREAIRKTAPQPTVILPEPLAAEKPAEEKEEISVNEYIDALLAQSLATEQELLSSMLDPEFNASYSPLQ